jgi:hypothetical protein
MPEDLGKPAEEGGLRKMRHMAIMGCLIVMLAVSMSADAGEAGQGSMPGMQGGGKREDDGMMKMGEKIFEGKIGPWQAEVRLIDMKAQLAKMKVSEQVKAKMKNTRHLMVFLTDAGTKMHVSEGKGSVTVTGPDRQQSRYEFTGMQGHLGVDVAVDKPGQYKFDVEIESGGKKGAATFTGGIK